VYSRRIEALGSTIASASVSMLRRFRHQLLQYRQSYPRLIDTDQDGRLSELDFLRQPKKHRRREDLP
jgi:hypothetical protein